VRKNDKNCTALRDRKRKETEKEDIGKKIERKEASY